MKRLNVLENSFKGRSLNLKVLGSVPRVGIAFEYDLALWCVFKCHAAS